MLIVRLKLAILAVTECMAFLRDLLLLVFIFYFFLAGFDDYYDGIRYKVLGKRHGHFTVFGEYQTIPHLIKPQET